ncbi:MAG: UDP-N-acetylmuramoyl-L-alanyl-D-glutamate--2,6-diaminopimelate ligase [Candidatus Wildermuthbacteria bacterium]|nr:UDP-N-acetylmuramoyl-L-alanyl-D-glutamate--2,6-diaminopimelate ligase [Candidatus Wildermuthbacteria bacterium]
MKAMLKRFIPAFAFSWYHFLFALLGAIVFLFPARKLIVIGVTGTNGKSTTVEMIAKIFEAAGIKTASLSSVRFKIGGKQWRNTLKMTMPGRFFIQKFLRQAVNGGCTHAIVEATSEGIVQHRHRFLNFHTAVFTNLSPEHIERHGSFEKYKEAKGKLFQAVKKVHVINVDDPNAGYFLQFPAEKVIRYSLADAKNIQLNLKLLGEFNMYNALAAISVAEELGIPPDVSKRALETMEGVPGRMEVVVSEPFRVVVDYAFTPAALEKVYKTLMPRICVLGAAGGGRDKWKRPVLGKLAATHCREVIVTNEDPYEEDPQKIIDEVAAGAENKAVLKILDRREAIAKALSLAQPGDTVVITGKGFENSIAVAGGKKIPWDDRKVVQEEMDKLKKK